MCAKRSRKSVRECKFCGAGLDGRLPKTQFCSGSCRAKYWRRERIPTERYTVAMKALARLAECLYYPPTRRQGAELLNVLAGNIQEIMSKGHQAKLPGVDQ